MAEKPRVERPRGLGIDGARLWKRVTEAYELRVDELAVLEMAAKTADTIAQLEAAMAGQPLVVAGSMGQQREHPLLSEARQQRAAASRLLKQLNLPDSDTLTGISRSGQRSAAARAAVNARWARRGG